MKAEVGWTGLLSLTAAAFLLIYVQRLEINILRNPDQSAMYAAEISCAPHGGVKELFKAPAEEFRVACTDGTQVWGPVKSRLERRASWTNT